MINCNITNCSVNHSGKCYSGNGNLRAINPGSKHPDVCENVKTIRTLVMTFGKDARIYWKEELR